MGFFLCPRRLLFLIKIIQLVAITAHNRMKMNLENNFLKKCTLLKNGIHLKRKTITQATKLYRIFSLVLNLLLLLLIIIAMKLLYRCSLIYLFYIYIKS